MAALVAANKKSRKIRSSARFALNCRTFSSLGRPLDQRGRARQLNRRAAAFVPAEAFHTLIQLTGAGKVILESHPSIHLLHEMGTVGLGARLAAVFAGGIEDGDALSHACQPPFSRATVRSAITDLLARSWATSTQRGTQFKDNAKPTLTRWIIESCRAPSLCALSTALVDLSALSKS